MEIAEPLRTECVNTIKFLAVDGVEKANSGHPGMPMGCADLAVEIWTRHLRFVPTDPHWADRDRFVLSAGHGSMLLYALLHVAGYDLPLGELQRFRQLGSKTPGHPELHLTPGVETTTGPLGQGIANGIGMALASKHLAARFPGHGNWRVFGICSDGDLMEGVSHEAASLAGHLGLDNLVFVYDDNHISIDGETEIALSDDAARRFEAYGWFVQRIDGHDPQQIRAALDAAVAEPSRPSLICARTHIGKGSPNKQDSEKAHGSPLGKDEVAATKKALGWPLEPTFLVPDAVRAAFAERVKENLPAHAASAQVHAALTAEQRAEWDAIQNRTVPNDLIEKLAAAAKSLAGKPEATRALGGKVEQVVAAACPFLIGGSADLNPSTNTYIVGSPSVKRGEFGGRNIHYGVREHGMSSINNGLAASGFTPFGSTFLVFADYLRPAVRLAALSELPHVFVLTHDSIFLGEDGPTHQPIETIAALRLIPNLRVVRPADAWECAAAWGYAIGRKHGPTALILTRQKLPPIERAGDPDLATLMTGAYRVIDPPDAKAVVVATGSEVQLAIAAAKALAAEGKPLRVISAPCLEALEDAGAAAYDAVLPDDGLPRISIEAGSTGGFRALVGRKGLAIGVDTWGASAPDKDLAVKYGLTPEAVTQRIRAFLG
ncbi:MAG: transketolase [Myxococcales bacterium]|nr:transketolase [Myxococcales bacterium]